MINREEKTTKFAKGAKRDAKIGLRTNATSMARTQIDRLKVDRLKEKTCAIEIAL
jgi:hypothetical protein